MMMMMIMMKHAFYFVSDYQNIERYSRSNTDGMTYLRHGFSALNKHAASQGQQSSKCHYLLFVLCCSLLFVVLRMYVFYACFSVCVYLQLVCVYVRVSAVLSAWESVAPLPISCDGVRVCACV